MLEIERIEEWIGADVVGADGERVGKLEDVFASEAGSSPGIGAIKTGAFGRKHRLVPLTGATVGREYVRVAHATEVVKDSPEVGEEGRLSDQEAGALFAYYGVTGEETSGYESATAREQRRAQAEADLERASELEAEAQRQGERADSKKEESASAKGTAEEAEERRRAALEEAEQLRGRSGGEGTSNS